MSEVSLTNHSQTRDSRFRLFLSRSDVPASCTSREFSLYTNGPGITSYASGEIDERDILRDTEDWIYNS